MSDESSESNAIASVTESLIKRFPEVSADRIRSVVEEVAQEFEDARIRDFVPVLMHHEARDRIVSLAISSAAPPVQHAHV
jgi:ribosomal protein L12E/L44/L45/RPP1/RPP2